MACSSEDTSVPAWPWNDTGGSTNTETENNPTIVSAGWTNVGTTYGELPSYISVYKSPSTLASKTAIAYIAVADMSKATFNVMGDIAWNATAQGNGATSVKTLTDFYTGNKSAIVINGGLFFYDNSNLTTGFYYSQSLLVKEGVMLSPNQNYYSVDWITMWYPTIGAFCQMKDGTFKAVWTYCTSDGTNYWYDAPADNDATKTPLAVPSATFPSTGTVLDAKTAIGGVSVLLHGGVIKNTYVQEMLDVSAASNQPRTAIGITSDNKLIMFVCEGREMTSGVLGLTTADVAQVMKDLGCTEALNLDGGGSSCMLVNGKETIKPSDGEERKVLDACCLK